MTEEPAINPENLISKLGFAILGGFGEADARKLQSHLTKKSTEMRAAGTPCPTRQTIHKWFKAAKITRQDSYQFIFKVASDHKNSAEWADLPADQKKTTNQVRSFCKKHFTTRSRTVVRERHDRVVEIRGDDFFKGGALKDEMDYFIGAYRVTKTRSGPKSTDYISSEYFEIERSAGALCVQWWYLLDGTRLGRFDGNIYFQGEWLWCVLHSPSLGGRFRMICLPHRGWGRIEDDLRGGIILGTSPDPQASMPVATRFLVEPSERLNSDNEKLAALNHLSDDKLEHKNRQRILAYLAEPPLLPGRLDANPFPPNSDSPSQN